MNEVAAVVIRLDQSHAWVRTEGAEAGCQSCASRKGCGISEEAGARVLRLPNSVHARVGDRVVLRVAQGAVMRAVWLAYLLPLAASFVGAAGLFAITGSELMAFAGMLLGLVMGFIALRRNRRSCGSQDEMFSIELS